MFRRGNGLALAIVSLSLVGQASADEIRNRAVLRKPAVRIALSGDGKTLASAVGTGIFLWDVARGEQVGQMQGHSQHILALAYSPDSKTIASGGKDLQVCVWDAVARKERGVLRAHQERVIFTGFLHEGKTLATGSTDGVVKFWDVATLKETATHKGDGDTVMSFAVSPDGKTIVRASAGVDFDVQLWDTESGKKRGSFKGLKANVLNVLLSQDGKRLAGNSYAQLVKVWDLETGKEVSPVKHPTDSNALALSPDGKTIVLAGAADGSGSLLLYDVATGKELHQCKGHVGMVYGIVFSPDGKTLYSGGESIRIWDLPATAAKPKE
jgi:WD40 repeat protein